MAEAQSSIGIMRERFDITGPHACVIVMKLDVVGQRIESKRSESDALAVHIADRAGEAAQQHWA